MQIAHHVLAALSAIAIAIGAAAPAQAGTILQGTVFDSTTISTIFDTGPQTSSGTSDTLPWTCTTCPPLGFTGSGTAKVVNGSLGVKSTVSVTGPPASTHTVTTHSYAEFLDTLTITGGTGSGFLQLDYSVKGTASHTGTGKNDGSIGFGLFGTGITYRLNGGSLKNGSGPALFGDGAKDEAVTIYLPFTYDIPVDVDPFFVTGATFSASLDTIPWTGTWDFFDTATLESLRVFAGTAQSPGQENTSADIRASSGLIYGPNGIARISEPSTLALFWAGLAGLGVFRRRKARRD
jgi:hypothetical protein